jgi:hypothetical protein
MKEKPGKQQVPNMLAYKPKLSLENKIGEEVLSKNLYR